jgi:hypothetical protein
MLILCLPISSAQARVIYYQKKMYRGRIDNIMKTNGESALYIVPFENVDQILPEKHKIQRRSLKLVANRYIPGKSLISVGRRYVFQRSENTYNTAVKDLFSSLNKERTHTYVIIGDQMSFAESTNDPKLESAKDIFTKHYLISGQKRRVNFSGEFRVYQNKVNGEVFVVLDNNSGTYKPKREYLNDLKDLLDYNLNQQQDDPEEIVYFVTKNFDQKIDMHKLFNHIPDPFEDAAALAE